MAFKPLQCPSCSGKFQVTNDCRTVRCAYCGTEIIVSETLGTPRSPTVENLLTLARAAGNSGNSQEAYDYYTRILEIDSLHSEAWFGKGEASGWLSTFSTYRTTEAVNCVLRSLELTPSEERQTASVNAANSLSILAASLYLSTTKYLYEFIDLDCVWSEHLDHCSQLLMTLQTAHSLNPADEELLKLIVSICQDNIKGAVYYDRFQFDAQGLPVKASLAVAPAYKMQLQTLKSWAVGRLKQINPQYREPAFESESMGIYTIVTVLVLMAIIYYLFL